VPKLNLNKIIGNTNNIPNKKINQTHMDNSFIEKSFLDQMNTTLLNDLSALDIPNGLDELNLTETLLFEKTKPHESV